MEHLLTGAVAILGAISASFLFELIKNRLSRQKYTKINVRLPEGNSYELIASKGNQPEADRLVRSIVYSEEQSLSMRSSTVRLLDDIVHPTLEVLRNKLSEMGGSVDLRGFEKLPEVSVDPDAIKQVVFNLLMNAIKYSPEDARVVLEASSTSDSVEIRFSNPCTGIVSAADIALVFELGFRGQAALTKDPTGSGLGLFVVQKLMQALGGEVRAQSEGDRFVATIKIPRTDMHVETKEIA